MDNKSPDAFRTISEVAEDLDLPQHVLRFWETRFTQIKPMKRGGGRRYYRPDDIDLLKGIRNLLYDQGYTIKGVQKILKQNGHKFVIAVGAGDLAAVEALSASMAEDKPTPHSAPPSAEDDQLVGKARLPSTRRFFGLGGDAGKSEQDAFDAKSGSSVGGLSRDDRALLQEALYDLLECKRLLDQVR